MQSSIVNHEILCKEVISELSAAKQETDAFRQEVSKKNKEVQNQFSSANKTELEVRKKIAEKNEEVVELKKQTDEIKDNKSNQLGNNFCTATIQVQLGPTTIAVTSNTSESNTSCVNDPVDTGCSLGVHVSSQLYKSYNSRNYTSYFQQFKPECCSTEGHG